MFLYSDTAILHIPYLLLLLFSFILQLIHCSVWVVVTNFSTNKASSLWDAMTAGLPQCPVWCRLVSADPFTTVTMPTSPFLSEWAKCQHGNHPKWRNRTSDHESDGRLWIGKPGFLFEFPSNHMSISLHVTCDRQTDWQIENVNHYYSWPPHCGEPAKNSELSQSKMNQYIYLDWHQYVPNILTMHAAKLPNKSLVHFWLDCLFTTVIKSYIIK